MPLDLQPYLLRALEERAVYRLGESKPRPVNVRLVASTNRNLKQEMEEGRFRRDLYYRIGVVRLTIPPLRQRAGDIDFLIDHFNDHFSSVYGRDLLRFDPAMLEFLQGYDWPGNVRELRNLIENLVLMSTGGAVTFDDLPSEMTEAPHLPTASPTLAPAFAPKRTIPSAPTETGGARLDETERRVIEQAIADAGGNVSVAADRLGVARSTIYRKLHQYKAQLS
jgi:transcriptional regulator with PAS, ATPase and Fis domain